MMIEVKNITSDVFIFISSLVGEIRFLAGEVKSLPYCWMPFRYKDADTGEPHCGCLAFELLSPTSQDQDQ